MNLSRLSGLPPAASCWVPLPARFWVLQGTYPPWQIWLAPASLGPSVGHACAFN